MKTKGIAPLMLAIGLMLLTMTACKKENTPTKGDTAVTATDSITMPFRDDHYVFYSLKDGKQVPLADSASTKWDIGIRFASIIVNSHASGPGQGGIIVQTGSYDDFTTAPETGYSYDTTTAKLAVNSNPRSPGAWYLYNPVGHKLTPKAGLFFVIKTAEGKYAKLEVTQVGYLGWDPEVDTYPETLIYRFRYLYQADGSVDLTVK